MSDKQEQAFTTPIKTKLNDLYDDPAQDPVRHNACQRRKERAMLAEMMHLHRMKAAKNKMSNDTQESTQSFFTQKSSSMGQGGTGNMVLFPRIALAVTSPSKNSLFEFDMTHKHFKTGKKNHVLPPRFCHGTERKQRHLSNDKISEGFNQELTPLKVSKKLLEEDTALSKTKTGTSSPRNLSSSPASRAYIYKTPSKSILMAKKERGESGRFERAPRKPQLYADASPQPEDPQNNLSLG